MEKKAYSTKEVQEFTGLGRDDVLKLIKTGKIKAVRAGRDKGTGCLSQKS